MATVLSHQHQLQPQSHQHNLHQIHHHQIHHHHQLLYNNNNNNNTNNTSTTSPTSSTASSTSAAATTTTSNNNCTSFGPNHHQQSNNSSFFGQQSHHSHEQLQQQSYQQHPHHPQHQQQSEHFCKDCGVMFESSTSLEVHLSYHKENLLSRWATQDTLDKSSSSSAGSVSISTYIPSPPSSGGLLLLNSPPSPSIPRLGSLGLSHHQGRSSDSRGGEPGPSLDSYANLNHPIMEHYNNPQQYSNNSSNTNGDPNNMGPNSPYTQHRGGSGPGSNGSVGSRGTPNGPSSNSSFIGLQPPVDPPGYGEPPPNTFHPSYSSNSQVTSQLQQHPLFSPSTNNSDHPHQQQPPPPPPPHHNSNNNSQGGPGGGQRDSSSAILDLDSHTVHIYQPPLQQHQLQQHQQQQMGEQGFYRPYLTHPPPPLGLPPMNLNGWPAHAPPPDSFHLQLGPSPSRFSPAGYLPVEHPGGGPVTFAAYVPPPPPTSSALLSNGIPAMSPNANGFERMRMENPGYAHDQPGSGGSNGGNTNGGSQFNISPPGGVLINHLQGGASGAFSGVGMHQQQFMVPQQQPPPQVQGQPPPGLVQQNVINGEQVGVGRPSPSPGGRRSPLGATGGRVGKKGGPSPGASGAKTKGWKGGECKRPKTYQCAACNKWFTSSGHLKRHYGTTLHKNSIKQLGDNAEELMRSMQQPKGKKGSGKGKASTSQAGGGSTGRQGQNSSPPTPSTPQGPTSTSNGIKSNGFLHGGPPQPQNADTMGLENQPPSHLPPNGFSVSSAPSGPQNGGGYPTASPTNSAPYGPPPPTTLPSNSFLEPPHLQQLPLHSPHHHHHHQQGPPPSPYTSNGPFGIDLVPMQQSPLSHHHHHHFPPTTHHNGFPAPSGNGPLPPFSSVGLSHYESGGGSIPPPGSSSSGNPGEGGGFSGSRGSPVYHHQHGMGGGLNGGTSSPVNTNSRSPSGQMELGGGGGHRGGSPGSLSGGGRDLGVGSRSSASSSSSLDGMTIMMNMDGSEEDTGIGGSSSKSSSPGGTEGSSLSGEEGPGRKGSHGGSSGRPGEPEVLVCPVCFKTFLRTCYLTQHVNSSHSGGKPFKCPTCGKKFTEEPVLSDHVAKHGSDKPYKCESCPKQFNHKTDLKRHRSLHTGERPFVCPQCNKGFIRKDHMTKHTETHRKKDSKSKSKSVN